MEAGIQQRSQEQRCPTTNSIFLQGIYGGWGNFGSAASAMTLPSLALWFGGDDGWRYAIACTGAVALVYSFVYYRLARNTPKGSSE